MVFIPAASEGFSGAAGILAAIMYARPARPTRFLRPMMLSLLRRCGALSILILLLAVPARAGNISFGLSLTDSRLTVVNQGDTAAYYPAVMRLLADGRWQVLAYARNAGPPAELLPGASMEVVWPDLRPADTLPPPENFRPVMVRFFDQAGAGFGQISFFNQPPAAADILQASYDGGMMTIVPPDKGNIQASWLIWAQEEGIAPLRGKVRFEHQQPNARRIEWRPGMEKLKLNLGHGRPAALLLHETAQGYQLQTVYDGGVQGRQQRAAWLSAHPRLFQLAQLAAAAAVLVLLWSLLGGTRRKGTR